MKHIMKIIMQKVIITPPTAAPKQGVSVVFLRANLPILRKGFRGFPGPFRSVEMPRFAVAVAGTMPCADP